MNAYELAKYLEDDFQIQEGVIDMLREQAGELEYYKVRDSSHIKIIKEQADRIAELEKFNKAILKKGGCDGNICKRYDTHPHKELSDEDILSLTIWNKNLYELYAEMEKEDMIAFARAIIKASRGEEC